MSFGSAKSGGLGYEPSQNALIGREQARASIVLWIVPGPPRHEHPWTASVHRLRWGRFFDTESCR